MNSTKTNGLSANLLRCVAAFFVFAAHCKSYMDITPTFPGFFARIVNFPAWAGVWIFFLLSGYGIGMGFFTNRYSLENDNKLSIKKFLKFYVDRFIKIAPLYYLYCIFFEIFTLRYFFGAHLDNFFKYLFFCFNGVGGVDGLGHLWYVSIAMQLYLFMPFIYLLIAKLRKSNIILCLLMVITLICGFLARYSVFKSNGDWYVSVYTSTLRNLDMVIIGMLIAAIKTKINHHKWFVPFNVCTWIIFIVFAYVNNCVHYNADAHRLFLYQYCFPTVYAFLCVLIILTSGGKYSSRVRTTFEKIVNKLAGYTYSMYVFHNIIFSYVRVLHLYEKFYTLPYYLQYVVFFIVSSIFTTFFAYAFGEISKYLSNKCKETKVYLWLCK